MPGSVAAVFSEAEDFAAALSKEGWRDLLVTGRGAFRARLTQVVLHRLSLSSGEEELPRIAYLAMPADSVAVIFADGGPPVWSGTETHANEIVSIGPGTLLHARTSGRARWRMLQIPERDLVEYGSAMTGTEFAVPRGITRWQPPRATVGRLRELHRAAIRSAERRPVPFADVTALHALEQQLIGKLVSCLSTATATEETVLAQQHRALSSRFEELLAAAPMRPIAELCAALGASERLLRASCRRCFGMTPAEYRRGRAIQAVNHELRRCDPKTSTVAEIVKRHGFATLGRFAANYRAIYGELPSATLNSSYGLAPVLLSRSRDKNS